MKILVLNAGSSSVKFDVYGMEGQNETCMFKGLIEGIGEEAPKIRYKTGDKKMPPTVIAAANHKEAIGVAMEHIRKELSKDGDTFTPDAIGHRVVHGGTSYKSEKVDDHLLKILDDYTVLAPLHNPPNISGIRACMELFPETPNVGVFDTAFHATMPDHAKRYALPHELTEKHKLFRYGFHGTSHRFVSQETAKFLGKPLEDLKIVTCHLGNGASLCAVKGGKSIDTTMGFTPLEGLMMGTRTGDIDAGVVLFLMEKENLGIAEINKLLNKKSGFLGMSGVSNDARIIEDKVEEGHKNATLAFDLFNYRIKRSIGSMIAAMDGVDAIVFTAGIGENSPWTRKDVCEGLSYLGITLNLEENDKRGGSRDITTPDSKVKVLVIPTDEERMIARDTVEVLK